MLNETGDVAIVVNGEIYNFVELRNELEARGHRFRSKSDSETALHLYEEHGDGFAAKLDGMFALLIYDTRARRVIAARDRSGKKPLYYRVLTHGVAFASEVGALVHAFPDAPIRSRSADRLCRHLQDRGGPRHDVRGVRRTSAQSPLLVKTVGRAARERS
jgi:asparagine synthase (glutamine-hydrolysing)